MVAEYSTPDAAPVPMKTCTKCGETKPRPLFNKRGGKCKTCYRAVIYAARQANPERHRAIKRASYRKHHPVQPKPRKTEKCCVACREVKPLEHFPFHRRKERDLWESRCLPCHAAYYRAYHQKNSLRFKPLYRQSKARRRAHKYAAPINDFTAAQWREMQDVWDHRCTYCGKRAKGHLTQDHLTPLSKGGNHTASNVVPACKSCNSKKHTGPPLKPVQPLLLTLSTPLKKRKSNS